MYIDGTFKLAPPMFAQVVVIIGKKMDLAVPVMYCLLQVSFLFNNQCFGSILKYYFKYRNATKDFKKY